MPSVLFFNLSLDRTSMPFSRHFDFFDILHSLIRLFYAPGVGIVFSENLMKYTASAQRRRIAFLDSGSFMLYRRKDIQGELMKKNDFQGMLCGQSL